MTRQDILDTLASFIDQKSEDLQGDVSALLEEANKGPEPKVLWFQFERSTKGAHRLQELDAASNVVGPADGAWIGTLYVRKSAVGAEPPMALRLEVSIIN